MYQITLDINDHTVAFLQLFQFGNLENDWETIRDWQKPWSLIWDAAVSEGFQEAKRLNLLEEEYGEYRISDFGKIVLEHAKRVDEDAVFDVVLYNYGYKKINAIKAVRYLTGLGLKDAKELVEETEKGLSAVVLTAVSREKAEEALCLLRNGIPSSSIYSSSWDNSCPGLRAEIVEHTHA